MELVYRTCETDFEKLSKMYKEVPSSDKSIEAVKSRITNSIVKADLMKFDFTKVSDNVFNLGGLIIDFGG